MDSFSLRHYPQDGSLHRGLQRRATRVVSTPGGGGPSRSPKADGVAAVCSLPLRPYTPTSLLVFQSIRYSHRCVQRPLLSSLYPLLQRNGSGRGCRGIAGSGGGPAPYGGARFALTMKYDTIP